MAWYSSARLTYPDSHGRRHTQTTPRYSGRTHTGTEPEGTRGSLGGGINHTFLLSIQPIEHLILSLILCIDINFQLLLIGL